jgi:hypothetical protein
MQPLAYLFSDTPGSAADSTGRAGGKGEEPVATKTRISWSSVLYLFYLSALIVAGFIFLVP